MPAGRERVTQYWGRRRKASEGRTHGKAVSAWPSMGIKCSRYPARPLLATPMAARKVLAPVMLYIDGRLLGPMVGITFTAG
jgi:hypothetical protein